jgi:hypothetical protein
MTLMPNNSPEPPPITFSIPHSRLTVSTARLSFCRWRLKFMQKPRRFCGLNITRSIKDRIFLGFMGFAFMVPTGYVLYYHHTIVWHRKMGVGERLLLISVDEIFLTSFLLAACCFTWGIAAPKWLEHYFEKTIRKFFLILALLALLLLGVTIYILYEIA